MDWAVREIYGGLPKDDAERSLYVKRLRELKEDLSQQIVFDHLYANLDSLDNKANSMIQFVAVLVAIYSALVGIRINEIYGQLAIHNSFRLALADVPLLAGAVCVIIAGIFFLIVLKVHWSSAQELDDPTKQADRLVRVRDRRTVRYRWGRLFTFGAYIFLGISLGFALLGIFLEGPQHILFVS